MLLKRGTKSTMSLIVMFAPPPTGYQTSAVPARPLQLLFAGIMAVFRLRIEDTDRSARRAAIEGIIDGLSWLGLTGLARSSRQASRIGTPPAAAGAARAGPAYRCRCSPD
jgi:glutamyl/glutaminyl-tRNA synthetase